MLANVSGELEATSDPFPCYLKHQKWQNFDVTTAITKIQKIFLVPQRQFILTVLNQCIFPFSNLGNQQATFSSFCASFPGCNMKRTNISVFPEALPNSCAYQCNSLKGLHNMPSYTRTVFCFSTQQLINVQVLPILGRQQSRHFGC